MILEPFFRERPRTVGDLLFESQPRLHVKQQLQGVFRMQNSSKLVALVGTVVLISGCSTVKVNPAICMVAGALAGGGAAYVGTDHEEDVTALSAIGGGLLGMMLCKEPEAPPPVAVEPTPPPAPVAEPPPPPPPPPAPAAGDTITSLEGTNFDFDKATLRPEASDKLDHAASVMAEHSGIRVNVEGHTDSVGSDAYNQQLSERRAQTVVDYLTGKGVDSSRLSPSGYGESRPAATNDTAEGRAKNRRVDLIVAE